MKNRLTRRRFVRTLGATASAAWLGPSLLELDLAWGQNAKPYTRMNVNKLPKDSTILPSYDKAIKAMKALGIDKKLSWCYQAAIHGRPPKEFKIMGQDLLGDCGGSDDTMPGWKACKHGTAFFLPWHRLYLFWFERIVRKMSDDNTWALPYWDWENDRSLPKPFQAGTKLMNLYTPRRNKFLNDGSADITTLPPGFVGPPDFLEFVRGVNGAIAEKVFVHPQGLIDFSRLIERGPHNVLHSRVGAGPTTDGKLIGLMGVTIEAAEDPIFFLHHANIDRLWCKWLATGAGRSDPINNAEWLSQKFIFFDEDGAEKVQRSCDCLYPTLMKPMGYVYDDVTPVKEECPKVIAPPSPSCIATEEILVDEAIQSPTPPFILPKQPDPVYFTFTADSQFRENVINILSDPTKTIYLKLTDIWTATPPSTAWDVFLGPGWGPSLTSPFFVGAMALFGPGVQDDQQEDDLMAGDYTCAVNSALEAWLQLGLNVKLNVTFLPAGVVIDGEQTHPPPLSEVSIGHAQLIVQTVTCS